jgi:N-acetyl-1-D-myo-inositol-2-amino-2-deoxy-alpha-D-glucopyranoside deacetylase
MPARRLLLVHAHPDDETIVSGATMAHYAAQGVQVTLVTCTLGEEGEVLVPELAQLAADQADQLGGYRIQELAAAMAHLGVSDHRWLGGAGRFRDSGMMGTPPNDKPRAFWRADRDPAVFDEAVAAAVAVIREVRPQVLITYDDNGDYGHPDHIMAHRVATAAVARAGDPDYAGGEPWRVAKLYWTATPKSMLRRGFEALAEDAERAFGVADVDDLPFGVEDDVVTSCLDLPAFADAKAAALAAHGTQITVDGPFFALSNRLGREVLAVEHFRLVQGELGPDRNERGWETDLFSGLDVT